MIGSKIAAGLLPCCVEVVLAAAGPDEEGASLICRRCGDALICRGGVWQPRRPRPARPPGN